MGPSRIHTVAVLTGAALQDEGEDGQRHGTDAGAAGAGSDHSPDLNGLRVLDPALPEFETSSLDRLKDGNTAPLASAAASSTPTTCGSLPMLQIGTHLGFCQNSDGDIDQPAETPTCSVVSRCQLGSACELCDLKAAAVADGELQEMRVTELGPACVGRSQEAQQTGWQRVRSHTDGDLLQNSQCEHEHQNSAMTELLLAAGNSCSMETRKRKLDKSSISVLDVAKRPGIPKQARVEDNYNLNNNSSVVDILSNKCEVQHKQSRKLSVKQLIQPGARHRPEEDTVDGEIWPQSKHTDDVHVNLSAQGDNRLPGSSQPQAASERGDVSVGGELPAAMSASEASRQLPFGQLQSSQAQPDLWARMEVLCEPAGSPTCAASSTPADTVIQRLFTEKNFVFQLGQQPKSRSSWNPGAHPGSRVAKHVLAYDDGYHHGNIKTRSHNTKRTTSNKARSDSGGTKSQKTSSTSECRTRRSAGHHRFRFRSNSSSAWSSRSRSRSYSPADSCRSLSCGSDNPNEYACETWPSEDACCSRCHCQHQPGPWPRCDCCTPQSPVSAGKRTSSRSGCRSRSRYKPSKSGSPRELDIIQQLLSPLLLPASVTTLIVAPVTGATTAGKSNGGTAATSTPSLASCVDNKHANTVSSSSPESTRKVNGGQNVCLPNMTDRNKCETKGSNEAALEANANMSLPPRPQNNAHSRMSAARMEAGNPEHYPGPPIRSSNHFGEHSEHSLQREQPRFEPHYNNMGYHPDLDHSFSEDAGYEFYGGDYDYMYDERNDDFGFGNEPHPGHMHQRHPGPNTYYPRRPPPQGPRGPPQMFTSNERSYGPPRHGMGGPSSRMGPNGPVGSRGPRSPMGPRGHRPQGGPGGPLGPPVMRGPPRGSPYGPPRGSPYGPPGPMRPQGMRGPPGPGMMGQAGHGGPGGPRPRIGPPTRMQSPMPRQGSQPPGGLRPRMGPPPPGPAPREDQYLPPRSGMLPSNSGDSSFCSPLPNLSQPPPNFVASAPSLPPATSTPVPANQITDVVEPPPPLPPPKPPTPKPPPPPKKEEEKKEEIKPMTPLIPPEQAEQYRKLREQARKHARKQQRKQEHQAKGEPESSDDDEEDKAKRKEYEAKLTAEREEMEKAALLAVQDNGALHFEEGAAILMPATQPALVQQPTMMVQHHPLASPPSSYGLMPASQLLHAGHPGLHPSQLQNLQFMTSAGQPQLVQLPNGQMAYATAAPMAYQAGAPMMAMQHQAGAVPHQILLSSGGMHQVPVTAHPGLTVAGSPYMAQYVMATQVQAAQIQAAQFQAAQIQAAQAAQVQAAQAAQVQAAQAAQVQAAQAAQIQAAQVQAAQVQAAQAQVQSGMPGLVSGMHMGQHVLPGTYPQGQYILVPRVARPQI